MDRITGHGEVPDCYIALKHLAAKGLSVYYFVTVHRF